MSANIAALDALISSWLSPKSCVTRVTCVTTNGNNDLAGHAGGADCVTRVTEREKPSRGPALLVTDAQNCVTGKDDPNQELTRAGHAVTRSRTSCEGAMEGADRIRSGPQLGVEDWLAAYDERAGILEFEGGLDRGEAERLALEQVTMVPGSCPCAETVVPPAGSIIEDPMMAIDDAFAACDTSASALFAQMIDDIGMKEIMRLGEKAECPVGCCYGGDVTHRTGAVR
ncbi:hypothetical protein [Methylobacterium sp. WSM2598]|uniref:hypothetical protein n=1 Tax=Methylobacterium sp. WSM2598 TaxID=398261 RepID=UPI00037A2F29|nr:hypothetical protein [Methylobacterium sp. WSM2598]